MIIDKLSNIHKYGCMGIDTVSIAGFIARYKHTPLPEGRYDLSGDELYALVSGYETRESSSCLPESHLHYLDLQYIAAGHETLLWDFADELPITEDRTPEQDIRFHTRRPEKAKVILEQDMFVLLFPQDAHTPCLHCGEISSVEKIVFKIRVRE